LRRKLLASVGLSCVSETAKSEGIHGPVCVCVCGWV
jgi:hypothetical protein